MRLVNASVLLSAILLSNGVRAEGCASYVYSNGMNVEDVQGGTRIIATASVGVSFDDVDAVNDARDEATMSAKSLIAKFLQETVSSDETIDKAVRETKSMQGDAKHVTRTEVVERVKRLRNSSSALLRGVVLLGDCYTQGKELRVSVGLKPETIASAGKLSNTIGQSAATQPTPSSQSGSQPDHGAATAPSQQPAPIGAQPLNRVPSFSNDQSLRRF